MDVDSQRLLLCSYSVEISTLLFILVLVEFEQFILQMTMSSCIINREFNELQNVILEFDELASCFNCPAMDASISIMIGF